MSTAGMRICRQATDTLMIHYRGNEKGKKDMRKKAGILLAALVMAGCLTGCGQKDDTIHMATKPMTEQYILGSMMKTLIEQDTDLTVELTEGVGGGTANIQPAMEEGEFDFYPEYTGSGWNNVLKEESVYDESMFDQLQAGYEELDMTWTGMLGFNNTYSLLVTREAAEKYDLHTFSDLAGAAGQLVFGANYDFYERADGFDALCEAYGLTFKDTMDLDIGLKYDAFEQREIDVMNVFCRGRRGAGRRSGAVSVLYVRFCGAG